MVHRIRIGYMGIPFSNTEAMTLEFCREMNWKDAELVPLMSSADTVKALFEGKVDYGVLAVRNGIAGPVKETEESLKGKKVRKILEGSERIHHCLFSKTQTSEIKGVCSHIQAIGQCKENLASLYPDAKLSECSDTAYAAEMLSKGELPDDCAVLCRKEAGEHYGLYLVKENLEDRGDNETFFHLISI